MNSQDIFGAEIQYFRLDPQYWEPILRQFKDTGLRCVTAYVPWSVHAVGLPDKRHPAGVLDFEGRTNPRWLVVGDPDMMVWDYQNRTTQGTGS